MQTEKIFFAAQQEEKGCLRVFNLKEELRFEKGLRDLTEMC